MSSSLTRNPRTRIAAGEASKSIPVLSALQKSNSSGLASSLMTLTSVAVWDLHSSCVGDRFEHSNTVSECNKDSNLAD